MNRNFIALFSILAFVVIFARGDDTCVTPYLPGFCSEIVSDAPNRTVDSTVNNYLDDIEKALSWLWDAWTDRLDVIAARENFTVCDDCVSALKHSFCSSFAPSCGFVSCYDNSTDQIEAQCLYSKNSNQGTQCASKCENALNSTAQQTYCYLCEINCIASIITENCGTYMMSREMCDTLLSVCTCNNEADAEVVCQYFSPTGYVIPFDPSLSCTSSEGWCSGTRKRTTTAQPGVMEINPSISFTIPNSVGQETIADPLISNVNPEEGLSSSNDATVLKATLGLFIASLYFLV